jgi:hypothetical protein
MKEKQREIKPTPGGGDSIFDGVPGLPANNHVNVSSGPYSEELPVAGTTVGEVRRRFSDRLDIDPNAVSIVNGKPQDENYLLGAGESLMFVRHAGEKGGCNEVVIRKDSAMIDDYDANHSMPLDDLLQRVGPGLSTGDIVLPSGVKSVLSQGPLTIWFWEQPPRVHQLSWICADSPRPYGSGTTYRKVRIALPYLVIAAVFGREESGMPNILCKDECFFRNAPLKSLDDELCYPGLLNCSKFTPSQVQNGRPLSWICTQHLKRTKLMSSNRIGDRFVGGFEAVRYCLLETSFNLSSEHHEANSWYGESKKLDPRIATIERWEKETAKDPLFVLDVPWKPTGHTLRQLANRIFTANGGGNGTIKTADDIARLILNH